MQNKKVIVVGAGAAGVMAAGAAAENCADVLLLERNPKIGRKVLITGKGRCNVTHHTDEIDTLIQNIPGNGRFLYSAFSQFMPQDTVDFFEDYGVPLKVERGNRVFPQSDRAADIVDALSRYLADVGVTVQQARVCIFADSVILATGGKSYPKTGSTGDGYALAQSVGHTVTPLLPSLSALRCREGFCSDCMGLSLRNTAITVYHRCGFKACTVARKVGRTRFARFFGKPEQIHCQYAGAFAAACNHSRRVAPIGTAPVRKGQSNHQGTARAVGGNRQGASLDGYGFSRYQRGDCNCRRRKDGRGKSENDGKQAVPRAVFRRGIVGLRRVYRRF